MAIRAALLHPFGLTVLVASVLLVPAVRFLPGLESFSRWVLWALPLGFVAYVSSVIALRLAPPEPRRQLSDPELVELDSIRKSMTAQLEERRAAGDSAPSELTRMLSEAIDHLDTQVRPALEELLEKQAGLGNYLDQYESGELPLPEPSVLDRLKRIHDRQRAAIDECVQQASNAAGTLVALLQEGDDVRIAAQARAWANELSSLCDAIAEVLRGEDDVGELAELYERAAELPEVTADTNGRSSREEEPEERGVGEFRGLVEEALRQLNNPYALSTCEFVDLIPATLAATRSHTGNGTTDDSTPLEQAQALRQVLVSAVDHLKPPGDSVRPGAPQALQYHILHERYELGDPTLHIRTRHSIAESTFHRYRRDAVSAVADHLQAQEELIARGQEQA